MDGRRLPLRPPLERARGADRGWERARLDFGAPAGGRHEVEVEASGAVAIPARVGHRNAGPSGGFGVVGACPPEQGSFDLGASEQGEGAGCRRTFAASPTSPT